jgi:hypothetical protein
MCGGEDRCIKGFIGENLREGDHLEDQGLPSMNQEYFLPNHDTGFIKWIVDA